MKRPLAVIIGGGVAGLTAAHELQERGFAVMVYERNYDPDDQSCDDSKVALGGKARSFPVQSGHAFGWNKEEDAKKIVGLPAEHGFRFFPGFYRHVIDTLRRIPTKDGKNVFDNLVEIEHAAYAMEGRALFRFGTRRPETLRQLWKSLRRLFLQNPNLGLTPMEAAFAAGKLVNGMTMCDERREAELEHVPWADYMHAREMSEAYRTVVVNGLTQNFVAMDAELSSTKTAITIIARLLNDLSMPGSTVDRVLNGPTSDAWFRYWKAYLIGDVVPDRHSKVGEKRRTKQLEVKFVNAIVDHLSFDPGTNRITGLVDNNDAPLTLPRVYPDTDYDNPYYVLAVPVESAAKILEKTAVHHPEIFEHSPSLKPIKDLKVNWMVGLHFYLKNDVEMCPGHINYLSSRWAITSISQNQFWKDKVKKHAAEADKKLGDGPREVNGILSVILSDWDKPGIRNRLQTARQANEAFDVAQEAMWQIRAHLGRIRNKDAPKNDQDDEKRKLDRRDDRMLEDGNIVGFSIDPAIIFNEMRRRMSAGEVAHQVQSIAKKNETREKSPMQRPAQQQQYLRGQIKEKGGAETEKVWAEFQAKLKSAGGRKEQIKVIADAVFPEGTGDPMYERILSSWRLSAAAIKGLDDLLNKTTAETLAAYLNTLASALEALENKEPVFINTVGSAAVRPTAVTGIENLFLASDYVKTKTDLATMEGANEAARRAVNGILQARQSKRAPCALYSFEEPALLAPFKTIDKHLFQLGLPHPSFLVDPILSFGAKFSEGANKLLRDDDNDDDEDW